MDLIYLLDTNAWSRYVNRRDSLVTQRIRATEPDDVVLCSVVKGELLYGAHKSSKREENLALVHDLSLSFPSLSFDDQAAEHYGRIRAELAAKGELIGPNDLLIASIALAHDLTLVTHNTGEFGRVPGLRVEDWERPA